MVGKICSKGTFTAVAETIIHYFIQRIKLEKRTALIAGVAY